MNKFLSLSIQVQIACRRHFSSEAAKQKGKYVMAIIANPKHCEKVLNNAGFLGQCFTVYEADAAEKELKRQSYNLLVFGGAVPLKFPLIKLNLTSVVDPNTIIHQVQMTDFPEGTQMPPSSEFISANVLAVAKRHF